MSLNLYNRPQLFMSDKTFKQTISLLRCSTTLVAASMQLYIFLLAQNKKSNEKPLLRLHLFVQTNTIGDRFVLN